MSYEYLGAIRPARLAVRVPSGPGSGCYEVSPDLAGLGFSLKPPKFIRKLTLKKLVKPLLITAAVVTGAALIPGALPLLAHGVVGAGKLAWGGTKLAGRGVAKVVRFAGKEIKAGATALMPKAKVPQVAVSKSATEPPETPTPTSPLISFSLPTTAAQAAAQSPTGTPGPIALTQSVTSGGATPVPSATDYSSWGPQNQTTAEAGAGSSLVPLAIGAVALIAVTMALRKGRP